MVRAADVIYNKYNVTVLLKGGHLANTSNDLLYDGNETWFEAVRIDNPNTHGTGCTLSSAIAANLAKGMDMKTAVKSAKDYITGALSDMLDLGKGSGPLNHMYKFYPNSNIKSGSLRTAFYINSSTSSLHLLYVQALLQVHLF